MARQHERRPAERGQVVVIFAGAIVLFMLLLAVVVDVSWYWANTLRVQRAADAAALAGAVHLPANPTAAYASARAEARRNGYVDGANATVTPVQDSVNARQIDVTVSANVGTFFMRVVGINSIPTSRLSKAEFVLPVPMGSPENYFGVFGTLRGATETSTQTVTTPGSSGLTPATTVPSTTWTNPLNANATPDTAYAVSPSAATNTSQQWSSFNLTSFTPKIPSTAVIDGIQAEFRGFLTGFGTSTACKVNIGLSWNGGTSWSTVQPTPNLTTTKTTYPEIGSATDTTAWGTHAWVQGDFSNTNFRLRLSWGSASGGVNSSSTCATTRTVSVDTLRINVLYHTTTTGTVTTTTNDPLGGPGTPCASGAANCFDPDGSALNPRGFWATMNTQGASNVNGDAHQPYYDLAGSTVAPACPAGDSRACSDPNEYYNYAIEMPPNSTGGYVYLFDPGFCYTDNSKGTGDRWFTDGGNSSRAAISSWYELLNTSDTPYDLLDDTVVASSGSLFMNMRATDTTMVSGTAYGAECKRTSVAYGDGRDYHSAWFLLNPDDPLSGGPHGTVYRLHTTGTDPRVGGSPSSQRTANGEQSFAIYATASGTPRVYGLGAMQMYTPLTSSGAATSSEFYLAQIEAAHAGKTMELQLWDPGDTSPLTASLQVLVPTPTGWSPTTLSYRAQGGTSNSGVNNACNSNTGTNVTSIATEATGSNPGEFNGCWLTITIPIPTTYTGAQNGWWKIRYNMNGSGTSNDVTTWKVSIRGNPVHLKAP